MFCIINSIFRTFIWHSRSPRIKLEQLQRPKKGGGMALPNPWLYYPAAQLQHIARAMIPEGADVDLTTLILLYVMGASNVSIGSGGSDLQKIQ